MKYETAWIDDKGEHYIGDVSLTKAAMKQDQMLRERKQKYCSCHWTKDLCGVHALAGIYHSDVPYAAVLKIVTFYGGDPDTAHEWAEILT